MKYLTLYIDAFKRILDFKGKSDKTAFWSFILISSLVSFILGLISTTIAGIYGLAAFIPAIMLCVRRGHDAGTRWWTLLILIPFVGTIILGLLPRK